MSREIMAMMVCRGKGIIKILKITYKMSDKLYPILFDNKHLIYVLQDVNILMNKHSSAGWFGSNSIYSTLSATLHVFNC